MRIVRALLLTALLAAPAAAQNAAPKAPPPQGPKQVYAAMSVADRTAIQSDLVWTGHYNGLVNGDFGDRSLAAVRAYQTQAGGKPTGILNPQERLALAAEAKEAQERAGWRIVADPATGMRLGLPAKLVPQTEAAEHGTRWSARQRQVTIETFRQAQPGLTLAAAFDLQKREPANRKVVYSVQRPDFFVVTGLQGLQKFYVRGELKNGELRGVTILYDQAMDGVMEPVVIAMSSALTPFPTTPAASEGPPPKPKVGYGTGAVASAAGHILTSRDVIDGCSTITVAGLGAAERIADDAALDLALLRVYGANGLRPLVLAERVAPDAALNLLGVADPQAQGGAHAVTRLPARLGAGQALQPDPPSGFAGAAALDAGGKMAGLVGVKPQVVAGPAGKIGAATLIPAGALRSFLAAHGVTPSAAAAPDASPAASVMRVICVRK